MSVKMYVVRPTFFMTFNVYTENQLKGIETIDARQVRIS